MKPLFILLLGLSHVCSAQLIVDGKNITEDKAIKYISLFQIAKSPKDVSYQISFPNQPDKGMDSGKDIQNSMGKANFKSPMDAINFVAKEGWELLYETQLASVPGFGATKTYMFKRRD